MKELNIINNGLETIPILAEASSFSVRTSAETISVYVRRESEYEKIGVYAKKPSFNAAFGDSFKNEAIHINGLIIGSYVKITSDDAMTFVKFRWTGDDRLLITPKDINMLARPIYADELKVVRYIEEAEQNDIKPALGEDKFLSLKAGEDMFLLNGGTYQRDGKRYMLNGVKKALAYYVYSRMLESGSLDVTRQGTVYRRSEYSEKAENRDMTNASRETYAIADRYMEECLLYMNGECSSNKNMNSNRTKIKILGS